MKPTIGSICSGIGGIDLAFELAGFQTKWFIEIDPICQRVLRRHFPGRPILDDVREAGRHNLSPVDAIVGGTPCQDLSVAGLRKGLDGKRSNIFFDFIRVCDELQPAFALWENVPGAFSSNAGRDFAAVLGAFRELGARDIGWTTLDAVHFGVPQKRRRIFLVADFGGERAAEILFEPESLQGYPPPRRKEGKKAAGFSGEGSEDGGHGRGPEGDSGVPLQPISDRRGRRRGLHPDGDLSPEHDGVAQSLTATYGSTVDSAGKNGTGPVNVIPILEATARQGAGSDARDGIGIGDPGDPMFTLQASKQHGIFCEDAVDALTASEGTGPDVKHAQAGHLIPQTSGTISPRYGKGASTKVDDGALIPFDSTQITSRENRSNPREGDPSHALSSQAHPPAVAFSWQQGDDSKHNKDGRGRAWITRAGDYAAGLGTGRHDAIAGPAYGVRRLTPLECSRLQGLPDGWVAIDAEGKRISDSAQYRMLGNSVAVPCVAWIAHRMFAAMRQRREQAS